MSEFAISGHALTASLRQNINQQKTEIASLLINKAVALLESRFLLLDPPPSRLRVELLAKAIFQGGQYAQVKLEQFLDDQPLDYKDTKSEMEQIILILNPLKTQKNKIQFISNAVNAHLDKLDLEKLRSHVTELGRRNRAEILERVKELNNIDIGSLAQLKNWITDSHQILSETSQITSEKNDLQLSSRLKKGFISSKNLPQYFKYWENFVFETLNSRFKDKLKTIEIHETVNKIEKFIVDYNPVSVPSFTSNEQSTKPNKMHTGQQISRLFDLKNSQVWIDYNPDKYTDYDAQLLLNNLVIQNKLDKYAKKSYTEIQNHGFSTKLEIEIKNNFDLDEIKKLLFALVSE